MLSRLRNPAFRDKGIAFIIVFFIRTLIPPLVAAYFINTNPVCQIFRTGCVSPNIGVFDVMFLVSAIATGIWLMSGSKFAVWVTAGYVSTLLTLDTLGILLDPVNGLKVSFDIAALFIILRK